MLSIFRCTFSWIPVALELLDSPKSSRLLSEFLLSQRKAADYAVVSKYTMRSSK